MYTLFNCLLGSLFDCCGNSSFSANSPVYLDVCGRDKPLQQVGQGFFDAKAIRRFRGNRMGCVTFLDTSIPVILWLDPELRIQQKRSLRQSLRIRL